MSNQYDGNDTYTVGQSNGMKDSDFNLNYGSVEQLGKYNFAHLDQETDSGGNSQNNYSGITDKSDYWGFGPDGNDTYVVGQTNGLYDSDSNVNDSYIFQLGKHNGADVTQDIDSGDNHQSNHSGIYDDAYSVGGYLSSGADGNDLYVVGQANMMIDSDVNVNSANVAQVGYDNYAGVYQGAESGDNSQNNSSHITDYSHQSVGYDDNDAYLIGQSNQMYDNDYNFNSSNIGQLGDDNFANVEQDITSGNNSQSNSSDIFDFA
jgi:hypothetical protein